MSGYIECYIMCSNPMTRVTSTLYSTMCRCATVYTANLGVCISVLYEYASYTLKIMANNTGTGIYFIIHLKWE